jgi:hypothetical protein
LGRGYVNNLLKSVVRMFKWAVTEETVPPSVPDALVKVSGLRKGTDIRVREPEPIKPVPDEHFWPVVAVACPQIATMMQVQRLAGMRPDEVTIMRPCDLNYSSDVWSYRPNSHKTDWLELDKEILLGPRCERRSERHRNWHDDRLREAVRIAVRWHRRGDGSRSSRRLTRSRGVEDKGGWRAADDSSREGSGVGRKKAEALDRRRPGGESCVLAATR